MYMLVITIPKCLPLLICKGPDHVDGPTKILSCIEATPNNSMRQSVDCNLIDNSMYVTKLTKLPSM